MITRFIKQEQVAELVNLYHLARVSGAQTRYERMIWASKAFSQIHPEVSSTAAYKDLEVALV